MIIKQFIGKGESHKNFCEDFNLYKEINNRYHLFGVFDGCSSGLDSHFASSLIAKIISNEANFIKKNKTHTPAILLKKLIRKTLKKLVQVKNELNLDTSELLSTIILLIIDKQEDKADIIAIGDGFISVDYKQTVIDQNNQPNYIAYFIDKIKNKEQFNVWYDSSVLKINADKFQDISIATDGILSFIDKTPNQTIENNLIPVDFLTKDNYLINNKAMLSRKINILRNKHFFYFMDDISMYRIIKPL